MEHLVNENHSHLAFFGFFLQMQMRTIRIWLFQIFGAGAPVRKWSTFSNVTWKCVTALVIRVIVYFEQKRKSFLIIAPTSASASVKTIAPKLQAPIIQCQNEVVKSFICDPLGTKCRLVWDAGGRGKQHLVYLNLLELCQQRRLYSARTKLSRVFCDPRSINANLHKSAWLCA